MNFRIIFFFSLMFVLSCSKEQDQNRVWVEHEVAMCCNPWGEGSTANDLEERVIEFLEANSIPIFESRQRDTGQRFRCFHCCGCPTGNFVGVLIPTDDVVTANELGFMEE